MRLPVFPPTKIEKRNVTQSAIGMWLTSDGCLPIGYSRLTDAPEVSACIDRIASLIASDTIYLMRNTPDGDVRIRDELSRFVDIDPWPGFGTRQSWMSWIVSTLLGDGDGNAFVLPVYRDGRFSALRPMPGASAYPVGAGDDYRVQWRGRDYAPDEILHFRLHTDPQTPWRGRGYRVQADRLAASLKQIGEMKDGLSSPKYKPPLIVSVNADSDLSNDYKRDEFRRKFLEDTDSGKPWILSAEMCNVTQIKPLTLTDLAIKDTVELDKLTIASIFGVPPFMLGIGAYSEAAYNGFIRNVILPICVGIEQEMTLKLLRSDERYFAFNRRRLYSYDLKTLIDIDLAMSDRGYLNGDEVREDAMFDPAGLKEFKVLENYIPIDKIGDQKKLKGDSDNE